MTVFFKCFIFARFWGLKQIEAKNGLLPEGVPAGSVRNGLLHDALAHGVGHGGLLVSDAVVGTPAEMTPLKLLPRKGEKAFKLTSRGFPPALP